MISRTDHIKYLSYSYFVTFSNIVTGLVLFPMILKYQGVEALGIFGILFSTKSIIDIGIGWLSASVTKSLLKSKYHYNQIVTMSFIINSSYGLVSLLIINAYGYFLKPDYFPVYFIFSVYSFFSFVIIPCYEILNSKLLQYKVAFFRFLQQFVFMILSIGLYSYFATLESIFIGLLFGALMTFIFVMYYLYKNVTITLRLSSEYKKIMHRLLFTDGKVYFVNGISTILLLQIDVLLIDLLYGEESVGIYLILWRIPNTLIMLGWRLSEPLQHYFGKKLGNDNVKLKEYFITYEVKIICASVVAGLAYLVLGTQILTLWLGEGMYPDYEYMFAIPALVIMFGILQRFYVNVSYYTKGLSVVTYLQGIEILAKVLFLCTFFDTFNELSSLVGWAVASLFTLVCYRKNTLKIFNT